MSKRKLSQKAVNIAARKRYRANKAKAKKAFGKRSAASKKADLKRTAKRVGIKKYLKAPNKHDYPGVDTITAGRRAAKKGGKRKPAAKGKSAKPKPGKNVVAQAVKAATKLIDPEGPANQKPAASSGGRSYAGSGLQRYNIEKSARKARASVAFSARTEAQKAADYKRKGKYAKSIEAYEKNPGASDWPGVDTPWAKTQIGKGGVALTAPVMVADNPLGQFIKGIVNTVDPEGPAVIRPANKPLPNPPTNNPAGQAVAAAEAVAEQLPPLPSVPEPSPPAIPPAPTTTTTSRAPMRTDVNLNPEPTPAPNPFGTVIDTGERVLRSGLRMMGLGGSTATPTVRDMREVETEPELVAQDDNDLEQDETDERIVLWMRNTELNLEGWELNRRKSGMQEMWQKACGRQGSIRKKLRSLGLPKTEAEFTRWCDGTYQGTLEATVALHHALVQFKYDPKDVLGSVVKKKSSR